MTLLYSNSSSVFESRVDILPVEFIYIDNETYVINSDGDLLLLNGGYGTRENIKETSVSIVVNKDYGTVKVFDNIETYMGTRNSLASISSIEFSDSMFNNNISENFEKREGTIKASIPRVSGEKFSNRFRDRYLKCTYRISRLDDGNLFFELPYIKTKFRGSYI